MELFDKKYVHFMWEDELEGKEGFFANNIDSLMLTVNNNNPLTRMNITEEEFGHWTFVYYDPNYECKRAFSEGKQIQCRSNSVYKWIDDTNPTWEDIFEYRIKPEEPKTRPFEDTAELILHYQQHFNAVCQPYAEPLIWIKDKNDNRYLITGYDEKCILIEDIWKDMKDLFNDYVFLDGSPCGIKE